MMELNSYIESTNLSPTLNGKEVDALVKEALDFGFRSVCIPPFWLRRGQREIGRHDLGLVTVIGYPLGYQMTEAKEKEVELALKDGATELDIVMNLSAFSDGSPWVRTELVRLGQRIHTEGALMKVIVETDLWTNEQLIEIIKLVSDSGADFFKTSTGYHRSAVTPALISFVRDHLPAEVGIKASGGIREPIQARQLIEAGADRLGTSSGKIMVS